MFSCRLKRLVYLIVFILKNIKDWRHKLYRVVVPVCKTPLGEGEVPLVVVEKMFIRPLKMFKNK